MYQDRWIKNRLRVLPFTIQDLIMICVYVNSALFIKY